MNLKSVSLMDFLHFIALSSAFLGCAFVLNNFLTYIYDLPGAFGTLSMIGINLGEIHTNTSFSIKLLGVFQTISYLAAIVFPIRIIYNKTNHRDENMPNNISEIIVSAAFWSVLFVGIVDAFISFIRFWANSKGLSFLGHTFISAPKSLFKKTLPELM